MKKYTINGNGHEVSPDGKTDKNWADDVSAVVDGLNAASSGTNTGDVTLAAVGSSPAAAGASLSGQVLTLQPASASQPGVVTTGTQTIAGAKTLSTSLALSALAGTAGSGTGISGASSALVKHVVHSITVGEAALTDADTSQAITIWTVPAKTRILRIVADVTTPFTGGGVTACTLQVGISGGDTDAYLVATDCLSGAIVIGDAEAELGVALVNSGSGVGAYPDWSGTKAIAAQFDSVTANVADLTAGSVTFYIECVSY